MKIPPTPFMTTELFELNDQPYDHALTKEIAHILRTKYNLEKYPTRYKGSVRDCWQPRRPLRNNDKSWLDD